MSCHLISLKSSIFLLGFLVSFVAAKAETIKKDGDSVIKFSAEGIPLTLPAIPGYGRLDGILDELDQGFQKVAGASGLEVLVVLAPDSDISTARSGHIPPMKQKIFIQRNAKVSGKLLAKEFHKLRDGFAGEAEATKTRTKDETVEGREKAINEAVSYLEVNPKKRRIKTPEMLGFFGEDESSFCYAMLASHTIGNPGEGVKLKSNVVCLAFVKVSGTVVFVSVNTPFENKKSMDWAMKMTKQVRDSLLGRR